MRGGEVERGGRGRLRGTTRRSEASRWKQEVAGVPRARALRPSGERRGMTGIGQLGWAAQYRAGQAGQVSLSFYFNSVSVF